MLLVKTEKEIGTLVQKSVIDGRDIRRVNTDDLTKLNIGEFELLHTLDDISEFMLAHTIILNKLMNDKPKQV